ncbi:MAG: glycosyltransferase, partial [Synechococcus sp. SB0677_bin_5]|nr:glycosyltransferase [Synechococcus sp. SB0677_bin_5]
MPLSPVILGFGREGAMLLPEGWTGLDSRPHSPTESASTGDGQNLTWVPVWRCDSPWPAPFPNSAMGQRDLTVVLATYNEVEAVGPMVRQLLSQLDGEGGLLREVIVVDDDSPDGTADVVRQLGRQDPRIHLLLRCDRSGLASAIRDGLLSASGELAAVMDADGQHDPSTIHTAVALLERQGLDLVVASRFPAD